METATFGAGCFWGVESVFEQVDGVLATKVGYTGGFTQAPSYEDVCSHRTGHAEAVEVTFDPARVSYDTLLDIFWMNHDPTQLNRQGPDVGDNYRSVIFITRRSRRLRRSRRRSVSRSRVATSARSSPRSFLPRHFGTPRSTTRSISPAEESLRRATFPRKGFVVTP